MPEIKEFDKDPGNLAYVAHELTEQGKGTVWDFCERCNNELPREDMTPLDDGGFICEECLNRMRR